MPIIWLQFVFPAYIWIITAFIVVTSQLLVVLSRVKVWCFYFPIPKSSALSFIFLHYFDDLVLG